MRIGMYSVSNRISPERLPLRNATAARMSGGRSITVWECTSTTDSPAPESRESALSSVVRKMIEGTSVRRLDLHCRHGRSSVSPSSSTPRWTSPTRSTAPRIRSIKGLG